MGPLAQSIHPYWVVGLAIICSQDCLLSDSVNMGLCKGPEADRGPSVSLLAATAKDCEHCEGPFVSDQHMVFQGVLD